MGLSKTTDKGSVKILTQAPMLIGNAHLCVRVWIDDKRQLVVKVVTKGCAQDNGDLGLLSGEAVRHLQAGR
jgi:hypothetical protein